MLVRFKGIGKHINNQWRFDGDKFDVSEEDYKKYKDNLDIIDNYDVVPETEEIEDNAEEKELKELREKAKELGVKNAHLMGKEKLGKAIEEKTAPLFGENSEKNEQNEE